MNTKPASAITVPTSGRSKPACEALAGEVWAPIPTWDDRYEVSNMGRIRSLDTIAVIPENWRQRGYRIRKRGRVRVAYVNQRSGYRYITLAHRACGRFETTKVGRLVLLAFIGPCPEGMECCHNNGVRTDDRLANLRWDTHQANCADKAEHGTQRSGPEMITSAKLSPSQIKEIRDRYATGGVGQRQLGVEYGVHQSNIHKIVVGKSWGHV
jgi:hypothetical protein